MTMKLPLTESLDELLSGVSTEAVTIYVPAIVNAGAAAFQPTGEAWLVQLDQAAKAGLTNLQASTRDVLTAGFGVPPDSCDAALLFNILHAEEPVALLRAARDVVRPGGLVAVIHWRCDIATPRGPSLAIRPRPEQIMAWATDAGLALDGPSFALPPWHFGLKLRRP